MVVDDVVVVDVDAVVGKREIGVFEIYPTGVQKFVVYRDFVAVAVYLVVVCRRDVWSVVVFHDVVFVYLVVVCRWKRKRRRDVVWSGV